MRMAAALLVTALSGSSFTTVAAQAPGATSQRPVYAAVIDRDGKEHLVVGHLGGAPTRILSNDGLGSIRAVAISWSGTQVAFAYADDNGEENIGVINTDGSNFRLVTHYRLGYFEHVVWSTDDRTIFFDRASEPTDVTQSGVSRVRRVPADGSAGPETIAGSGYAAPTSARPGGRWLALNSSRPEGGYGHCAVMRVSGRSKHNVGPDNCEDALWRPGTSQLAFTRVASVTYKEGPTVRIWLLSLKTHRYHVIPNIQRSTGGGRATPLAWTRDGSVLYYARYTHRGALAVYRIRTDGTHKTDVTPTVPVRRTGSFALQPSLP
jgi:Tol biopolymer transport system component